MMLPGDDDADLGQWHDGTPVVDAASAPKPPRPPAGITPKGAGDPRQIDFFARLEDRPPAGVPQDVAAKFEEFALDVAATGRPRYSADAIMHRVRWHATIERGNRSFRCNDHWVRPLAVWFLARHPELPKFFELRERGLSKLAD